MDVTQKLEKIRVVAYTPFGDRRGVVSDWNHVEVAFTHNGLPTLQMGVAQHSPSVELLAAPVELAIELNTGPSWKELPNGRFISTVTETDLVDDVAMVKVSALGFGQVLRWATVWDPSPGHEEYKRVFPATSPGGIIQTLFEAALSRVDSAGRKWCKGQVSWASTPTTDSGGGAWGKNASPTFNASDTLEKVVNWLASKGAIDYRWHGRQFQAFANKPNSIITKDLTATVVIDDQLSTALPVTTSFERLATVAMFRGNENYTRKKENIAASSVFGRIERWSEQGQVSRDATADLYLDSVLKAGEAPAAEYKREWTDNGHTPIALVDYQPGNWISVNGEKLQVIECGIKWNSDLTITGWDTLGTRLDSVLERLARRTTDLSGGAVGSDSGAPLPAGTDRRTPMAPTGLVCESDVIVTEQGIYRGVVTCAWNPVTKATNNTDMSVRDYELSAREEGTDIYRTVARDDITQAAFYANPGTALAVRVRALSDAGYASAWSEAVRVDVKKDVTPPPMPSTPTVTAKLGVIHVTWDGLTHAGEQMPPDFDCLEIAVGTTPSIDEPDTTVFDVSRTSFMVAKEPGTYYVRARAKDYAENVSDWTEAVQVVVEPLVDVESIKAELETNTAALEAADKLIEQKQAELRAWLEREEVERKQADEILTQAKADLEARAALIEQNNETLQTNQTALEAANQELKTAQNELAGINTQIQAKQVELDTANQELTTAQTQLQAANQELKTTQTQLQSNQNELATAQATLQANQTQLESTSQALIATQTQLQASIDEAQTLAAQKNSRRWETREPSATDKGTASGDLWYQTDAGNKVVARWRWNGSRWVKEIFTDQVLDTVRADQLIASEADINNAFIKQLVGQAAFFKNLYANQLVISGDNLVKDPYFKNPAMWTTTVGMTENMPDGLKFIGGEKFPNTITTEDRFDIASDEYVVQVDVKPIGVDLPSGKLKIGLETYAGGRTGQENEPNATSLPVDKWTTLTCNIKPKRLYPYIYARFVAYLYGTQSVILSNVRVRARADTTTIADGAITTDKIVSNAITTDKIMAGAVSTREIAANAITANKLVANAVTTDKIAANSVTAAKLMADAITSDKIAANAVTADKIAANAITANKLVANAVTTDKIAANSVTTQKLVASAVTADKLAVNSVNADKIAANSINTKHLVSNSVTTEKLVAGAITSDKIAANAITGKMIYAAEGIIDNAFIKNLIADSAFARELYANRMVVSGANLVRDPSFSSESNWPNLELNGDGTASINTSTTGNKGNFEYPYRTIAVKGGQTYKLRVEVRAHGAWIDADKLAIYFPNWDAENNLCEYSRIGSTQRIGNTWQVIEGEVTVPNDAVYAQIGIYAMKQDQVVRTSWRNLSCVAMTDGELIVNGTIRGDHLVANTITGREIKALTIGTGHLKADAVTTSKLAAGSVTASILAANAVTADKIRADAIDGMTITGATIQTENALKGLKLDNTSLRYYDSTTLLRCKITAQETIWYSDDGTSNIRISTNYTDGKKFAAISFRNNATSDRSELWMTNSGRIELRSAKAGLALDNNWGLGNKENHIGVGSIGLTAETLKQGVLIDAQRTAFTGDMVWLKTKAIRLGTASRDTRIYLPYIPYVTSGYDLKKVGTDENAYLGVGASSARYKIDITDNPADPKRILEVKPRTWTDRHELEQYANYLEDRAHDGRNTGDYDGYNHLPRRVPGLIAEEVEAVGLTDFVQYNRDGSVQGLQYDRLWTLLIPLVKELYARIEQLEQ